MINKSFHKVPLFNCWWGKQIWKKLNILISIFSVQCRIVQGYCMCVMKEQDETGGLVLQVLQVLQVTSAAHGGQESMWTRTVCSYTAPYTASWHLSTITSIIFISGWPLSIDVADRCISHSLSWILKYKLPFSCGVLLAAHTLILHTFPCNLTCCIWCCGQLKVKVCRSEETAQHMFVMTELTEDPSS